MYHNVKQDTRTCSSYWKDCESTFYWFILSQMITIWLWYVNKQSKCPHYAKHQASVSSENQNILKLKTYKIFIHYFIACQKHWLLINFKILCQSHWRKHEHRGSHYYWCYFTILHELNSSLKLETYDCQYYLWILTV